MLYDVAILGAGPSGLSAALALGRASRRVIVFDAGSPRNEAATHIHNFVTRDGTPPEEFRRLGREQLGKYPGVEFMDEAVLSVEGERDDFELLTVNETRIKARRIILCTGMVDEMLDIPGFSEAWGHSIYQCPYCHGWEVKGQRWGYLAIGTEALAHGFAAMLKNWSDDVVVFHPEEETLPDDIISGLENHNVSRHVSPIKRLVVDGHKLTHVELADGQRIACNVLFAHPPQHQVKLVQSLELELDPQGFVQVDTMTRQTSRPGIYASGDLTTRAQGAIMAAATGTQAGAMVNYELSMSPT